MTTSTPTISVLMSVYNGERYLAAAMDSILAQTFRDFELIVIDDGSKDASPAILREYAKRDPRVKLTVRENKGLTVKMDEAFAQSQGQYRNNKKRFNSSHIRSSC
jgi:glycosyltransferase involved in cell wall biosynthesis